MDQADYLKGSCTQCGGHIEFPAESAGMNVACPHCGQNTVLSAPKKVHSRKTSLPWILGVAAVLVIVGAAVLAHSFATAKAPRPSPPAASVLSRTNSGPTVPPVDSTSPPVTSQNKLAIGPITLERTKNSSLVYAVGVVKNESDRQRFGVKVELDLLDGNEAKIGTASDYLAILEPRKSWRFKALVLEAKTVSARLAAIKEDQ